MPSARGSWARGAECGVRPGERKARAECLRRQGSSWPEARAVWLQASGRPRGGAGSPAPSRPEPRRVARGGPGRHLERPVSPLPWTMPGARPAPPPDHGAPATPARGGQGRGWPRGRTSRSEAGRRATAPPGPASGPALEPPPDVREGRGGAVRERAGGRRGGARSPSSGRRAERDGGRRRRRGRGGGARAGRPGSEPSVRAAPGTPDARRR